MLGSRVPPFSLTLILVPLLCATVARARGEEIGATTTSTTTVAQASVTEADAARSNGTSASGDRSANGTSTAGESSSTSQGPSVAGNGTARSVCEVCECTAAKVDCANRKLDSNLHDYRWPNASLDLVTFEGNEIARVRPFPKVSVARLTLRGNRIDRIDKESFKWVGNLTELDLSRNLLSCEKLMPSALEGKFAPEEYQPLVKLKLLNLSSNQFHTLNHDLFEHLACLRTLDLSDNPFIVFDHSSTIAISGIPYLEELHLSRCKLKNLINTTQHSLRYLKKLDLSWNEFEKLPDALTSCPSLQTLLLDGNPIYSLGFNNSFPSLPKLKTLQMNNMPSLLKIENLALSNLEALEILTIENCTLLSEIDEGALVKQPKEGGATWPPLKTLKLSNNALRYLPASLVARWDKLEKLQLVNNQWICDCGNQYFIGNLLTEHGKRLMGPEELGGLRCSAPPEHRERALVSLAGHDLRCLDRYAARPERDAAVLVGALLGVLLAVPVLLALFAAWRRGFLFCGAQGPASFSRAFYRRAPPYDDGDA